MTWHTLNLWAEDEEKRLHHCIREALLKLIDSKSIEPHDDELYISGKLRPFLYKVKKDMKLAWTLQPEASTFNKVDDPEPFGHPDVRFAGNTPDYDDYNYDIECKLVRVKRKGKSRNYCKLYVTDGIQRFQNRKYTQSLPPMGTMIGYVQEGEIFPLLDLVNKENVNQGLNELKFGCLFRLCEIISWTQHLQRKMDDFVLYHMWADLRTHSIPKVRFLRL